MSQNVKQCSACGFVAAVSHPDELAHNGWLLPAAGRPGTYCSECAKKLSSEQGVPPPRTRAQGRDNGQRLSASARSQSAAKLVARS